VKTVRTFWHGPTFGLYERLSVSSYVAQGHTVEVYAYDPIELPAGATWCDAAEVLPRSELFTYQSGPGRGSFAAFANRFRYRLIHERGGIWTDTDVFCLRPLNDLPASFIGRQDDRLIACSLFSLPQGSAFSSGLYHEATAAGRNVSWGQTGPDMLTRHYQTHPDPAIAILPPDCFYAVPWNAAMRFVLPEHANYCRDATRNSHCVHWWNEIFRRVAFPKDKLPPAGSFLTTLAMRLPGWDSVPTWDEGLVNAWVSNYNDAQAYRQIKQFVASR